MKTDFTPMLQRDLTGIGSAIQGVAGLTQTIGGWIQSHRATKKLENLKSPTYNPNKSILDYYNTALQRYNVNPYQSSQYQNATNQIGRNTASILNNLKGRGGSVAAVGKLASSQNDAAIKAGISAENEQNQRFSQLGGATTLKAGEDDKAFQYNQLMPYRTKANLYAAKAGGGNQIMNSGLSNIFQAGSSLSQMDMLKKMYGTGSKGTAGNG